MRNCFSIESEGKKWPFFHLFPSTFFSLRSLFIRFFYFNVFFRFSLYFLFFNMFWYFNYIYCFHLLRYSASWLNVLYWINISMTVDRSVFMLRYIPCYLSAYQNASKIANTKNIIYKKFQIAQKFQSTLMSKCVCRYNGAENEIKRKTSSNTHTNELCVSVTFWSSESLWSILNGQ